MKILFVGDAVVPTGFSRCTHAACDALHAAGHDVHLLGINFYGDPHSHPYPIYPCQHPLDEGRDGIGITRLPVLLARLEPDLVILLNDPWNVAEYFTYLKNFPEVVVPPIIAWLAVDGCNVKAEPLNQLFHVITWTEFASEEIKKCGYTGESTVIPLGVDHSLFQPRERAAARKLIFPASMKITEDHFVVGVVGRNQPRKRLDLTISAFARFVQQFRATDAALFLYVAPTGDVGTDIRSLVKYYGIQGQTRLAIPHVGHGLEDSKMPDVYAAMDVYLTTTQGEGWGLPALEAMACGIPCVVPNWSGLGSWVGSAAIRIPCPTTALTAPQNQQMYTIGGIPDERELVIELGRLYEDRQHRALYRQRGIRKAAEFSWDSTGHRIVELIESLKGKIERQKRLSEEHASAAEAAVVESASAV